MGNEFFVSNHIILVYMFCLISIGLSLSDEANKMKFLNIERAQQFQLSLKIWALIYEIVLEKFSLKNPRINKECMSSLTFCYPVIWQFLIAAIFFATDCKELKVAQTA